MRFSSCTPTLFKVHSTVPFASRIKLHGETGLHHEVYSLHDSSWLKYLLFSVSINKLQ